MPKKKILIIGGVAGGASCAARLRRQDEDAEIILFERGAHVSFANCGLPYFIGGVIEKEEALFLANVELFKDRFDIDARIHSEVIAIDPDKKTVRVLEREGGKDYTSSYDELVLSPGSTPIKPPLPGIDLEGIFSLRNVPDSKQIKDWIEKHQVKKSVVIGGGFIGLEMVENLCHLGIETTLVERDIQILAPLDPEMSVVLQENLSQHGVQILLGHSVSSFKKSEKGIEVITDNGKSLLADMVILSIGVSPESGLAKAAQLKTGQRGHIVVDSNMRSSDPHIYAVGDCIEVRCTISGKKTALPLAGPANRQGRIAADMISGGGRFFRGVQGTAICGLFELSAAATGLNEKTLKEQGEIEYAAVYAHPSHHVGYYPDAKTIYIKLLFDTSDGRILGAQAIGEVGIDRRIDVIAMAIQLKATVFDLEESELCYAPQFGAAKDPVNIVGMIAANSMRGDLKLVPWKDFGQSNILVLDVRDEDEVREEPLPGALNIPLNDLRGRLGELTKEQEIQVSCAQGKRAYNAVRFLTNLGYQAGLLSGGIQTFARLKQSGLQKG